MTNYKTHKVDNHTITEQSGGLYLVRNNLSGVIYHVDVFEPFCSCNGFKFTQTNKTGHKKPCKHLRICKNIIKSKE